MEDNEDEKIQEDVEFELIDEFGNFMSLLVKWDLSDVCSNEILKFSKSIARDDVVLPTSVKQGRKFLDQLAKSHTSFKKVQHKTTLKYLIHQTKQKKSQKFTSLKGLLGKFALENFDEFFDSYKEKNSLASDALLALSQFLIVLNEFFDLDDNLTEEMIINNTIISWYSYTNMTASGDCVRA
ncbi:15128_t:CDS:2, partial [Rhizophagus irregularis]